MKKRILLAAFFLFLFSISNDYANNFRSVDAIGGEIVFLFSIPLIFCLIGENKNGR